MKMKTLKNKEKREMLIALIVGDGYINVKQFKNTKKGSLKLCHSPKQADYLDWKIRLIQKYGLINTNMKISKYTRYSYLKEYNKKYPGIKADTAYVKYLKHLHKWVYKNGEKNIDFILQNLTTPLSLSIWMMDDGTVYKRKKKHIDGSEYYLAPKFGLCTHDFKKDDNLKILEWFKKQFNIDGYIVRNYKRNTGKYYYFLNFDKNNSKKIWDIIKPYVIEIECMRKKFDLCLHKYE